MPTVILEATLPVTPVNVVPTQIFTRFTENLKNAASIMKQRWDLATANWTALAKEAAIAFGPFVNPAFVSRRGRSADFIKRFMEFNMEASEVGAKQAHDNVFANDGDEFKRKVDEKANNWLSRVAFTLEMTSTSALGERGPGPYAASAMTGDRRGVKYTRGSYQIDGLLPTNITSLLMRSVLRSNIVQLLVQLGVAVDKGFSVTDANAKLDDLITKMVDAAVALPPPATFVNIAVLPDLNKVVTLKHTAP
ncbi:MAG TPA: hypothetical protein VJ547_12115 [Candidatus Thermoplasmatota archaeon]|nr:hypothetical protein [Candidatus Thermoplasmatota archaeon]